LSSSTSTSVKVVIVVISRRTIAIIVDFVACCVVAIVDGDTFFECTCVHLHAKYLVNAWLKERSLMPYWHIQMIPVCIRGVPVCVRGVRQKNSHMGRPITHNEVVRIWGLTFTPCCPSGCRGHRFRYKHKHTTNALILASKASVRPEKKRKEFWSMIDLLLRSPLRQAL
jgi:hypothetical protein